MAQARGLVLPVGARGTYHVISRCTRREFLLGGAFEHRRDWAAELLTGLLQGFAIDLQAYAIMSNHIHLVLRPRPDRVEQWAADRVAQLGLRMIPVRPAGYAEPVAVTRGNIVSYARQTPWVKEYRARLSSISWFMKLFKQRLARRANAEDQCSGHFWESRFQTVPLLDTTAVFACMAYVDRNPLRARMVTRVADSRYTSVSQRLVQAGQVASNQFTDAEVALGKRLTPLAKCRPIDSWSGEYASSSLRLPDYLALIDHTAKPAQRSAICERIGINSAAWPELVNTGGLFQGVAAGHRASRDSFARSQGKRTLADKTKIWIKK